VVTRSGATLCNELMFVTRYATNIDSLQTRRQKRQTGCNAASVYSRHGKVRFKVDSPAGRLLLSAGRRLLASGPGIIANPCAVFPFHLCTGTQRVHQQIRIVVLRLRFEGGSPRESSWHPRRPARRARACEGESRIPGRGSPHPLERLARCVAPAYRPRYTSPGLLHGHIVTH
jgi:hypothetical protein